MMTQLSKAIGLILLSSFTILNVSAQTEFLVKVDPATGVHTKISALYGVNWIMISPSFTTFDEMNHRFIFKGGSDNQNWQLYSVDAVTGNILTNPSFPVLADPLDNIIELQYDNAGDKLYGLHWDNSESREYFVSIDPVTGSFAKIDSLPGVHWIMMGNTTFDKNNHRYVFKGGDNDGNWYLYSVDVVTGDIVSNPFYPALSGPSAGLVFGLQYNNTTNKYYGLNWSNTDNKEYFVTVDAATGLFTIINSLPGVMSIGNATFDEVHNRFIFRGADIDGKWYLYSVDAATGNIISSPLFPVLTDPADNVIEFKYDNTTATLYALHWDAHKKILSRQRHRQPEFPITN